MMVNRKGEIGKFMTAFPVFIIIILLVAGFVVFSEVISKNGNKFGVAQSVSDSSLLLETTKIKLQDKEVTLRFIDAVNLYNTDKSALPLNDLRMFSQIFIPLMKEGSCLLISYSKAPVVKALKYNKEGYICSPLDLAAYGSTGIRGCGDERIVHRAIDEDKGKYEDIANKFYYIDESSISYYYGRCLG